MKSNTPLKQVLKVSLLLIVFVLCFSAYSAFAQSGGGNDYTPLAPIPGFTEQDGRFSEYSGMSLSEYIPPLYDFGVGLAVALAIIMIMWGGIEYITTFSGEGKSSGKERIQSALLGLLLALSSYIILNTINPKLLSTTNFSLTPVNSNSGASPTAGATPSGSPDLSGTSGE